MICLNRRWDRLMACGIAWLCLLLGAPVGAQSAADEQPDTDQRAARGNSPWLLEAAISAGGDTLGAVSLIRSADNAVLASEELTAADSLRIGGVYLLDLAAPWDMQFAAGIAWSAIGINQSLNSVQSLNRYYLRAEAVRNMGRWRIGGGIFLHRAVTYRSTLIPSVSLDADPGLRLLADYRLWRKWYLGAALESAQYNAANRDFDASSVSLLWSFRF